MREEGDRIGPYGLVRRIGEGSAGEVWEAVLHGPAGFRKPVALKLLRAGPSVAGREMLVREARLGAALQHPNVVGTLQLAEHGGTWCLALELVRGVSVDVLCRRAGGRLPGGVVLDVGAQVAAALHHVHDGPGLVHRDVKPANLLVDPTGLVKLADLGVSSLSGEATGVAGTPGYMAPEQVAGRAEPRSDLFALGVVLYALAVGRRPFGTGVEAVRAVAGVEERLAADGFLASVDAAAPGLAEVVRRCLRHAPEDRYPTARALGDALSALRAQQPPGPTLLEVLAATSPEVAAAISPTPASEAQTRVVPSGNLRAPRDAFVGRAAELAEVERAARDARWVALVGPGGIGKTRTALEAARRLRQAFPGGAWAFDLAPAQTADEVCGAVAAGLGVELDRRDPVGQVGRVLGGRGRTLVVVDNLEQCVAALPETLGRWIDLAEDTTFLGTSRVVPGLAGERTVALGELTGADAAALFLARAPRPLSEGERAHVEPLVDALEHVPLAIELAAARLRTLPADAVRARLSLALLGGGGSDRPARHRSVAASLAWSWDLLSPAGRRALAQLSVLEGPFDLAAAEAVLDVGPDAPWAIDLLQELVDASLLLVQAATGRFRVLVVVREFAAGLLPAEECRRADERHGAHFAQHGAREALDALERPGGAERYARLAADLDDVVAACRRAVARGDVRVASDALAAAEPVLLTRGPASLSLALARAVRGMPQAGPADQARAAAVVAAALRVTGAAWPEVLAAAEEAVALARTSGRPPQVARALRNLGVAHSELGLAERARPYLEEALAVARAHGLRRLEGVLLMNRGNTLHQRSLDEARADLEHALAVHREVGDRRSEGVTLANLANLDALGGRPEDALAGYERALAVHRERDDARATAVLEGTVGGVLHATGRVEEARRRYEIALALARRVGLGRTESGMLNALGSVHLHEGRPDEGRALLERALTLQRAAGDRQSEGVTLANLGAIAWVQGRLHEAEARFRASLAAQRDTGSHRQESRVLSHLSRIALDLGRREDARALAEQALALARGLSDRRMEGIALTELARAEVDPALALTHLEAAEPALAPFAVDLAFARAARAEALHRAGEDGAGALALAEVLVGHAEVACEVRRVRALLHGRDPAGGSRSP